jgi:hypothetical protein
LGGTQGLHRWALKLQECLGLGSPRLVPDFYMIHVARMLWSWRDLAFFVIETDVSFFTWTWRNSLWIKLRGKIERRALSLHKPEKNQQRKSNPWGTTRDAARVFLEHISVCTKVLFWQSQSWSPLHCCFCFSSSACADSI